MNIPDRIEFFPSKACGTVIAPPSKSMAHRYLICASLADGESTIEGLDMSEDVKATSACIGALGASADIDGRTAHVCGTSADVLLFKKEGTRIFRCGESGSTLRFFMPIAMLSGQKSLFTGTDVLLGRPLSVYEDICRLQHIRMERLKEGILIEGRLRSGTFEVAGNISSQFISGLLFALPLLEGDSRIILSGKIESRPYIDMTLQVLGRCGISAGWESGNVLAVSGSRRYNPFNAVVEGDYSNAAFFDALNTVGGNVKVKGLDPNSLQGDRVYAGFLEKLQKGFASFDISDCPDLGPVLLAVAAANHGGEFTGTARLKIKESDRGAAMKQELEAFGVAVDYEDDRITVHGSGLRKPDRPVYGHNDHRIVMALSTLLSVTGGVLEGACAVKKSLPDYFDRIRALGIDFHGV